MRAVAGGGRDEVEVACCAPQQLVSRAMAAGFSLAPPAAPAGAEWAFSEGEIKAFLGSSTSAPAVFTESHSM